MLNQSLDETDVRSGFEAAFGATPDGVWSAPGRVNLIGEHTDYNDGFVLPFAIDRRTRVALRKRDDRVVRVASASMPGQVEVMLDQVAPGAVAGWSTYPLGTAWAVDLVAGGGVGGFDAWFVSEVPVGAGLSSSAAIECALAVALNDIFGLGLGVAELVTATHRAENEIVGAPTGILDQSASLRGVADAATFLDCRSRVAVTVPLGLAAAGLTILVTDTRVTHAHASGGYAARRASCELGASTLGVPALRDVSVDDLGRAAEVLDAETFRRVRHIVTENARVLESVDAVRAGNLTKLGRLLTQSHASMRDDFEISVPELDLAVEVALATGAAGARMTGGGFGGSAIALIDTSLVASTTGRLQEEFAAHGFGEPHIFTVAPSVAAGRGA